MFWIDKTVFEIHDLAGGVPEIVLVLNRDISRQFSLCTLLDVWDSGSARTVWWLSLVIIFLVRIFAERDICSSNAIFYSSMYLITTGVRVSGSVGKNSLTIGWTLTLVYHLASALIYCGVLYFRRSIYLRTSAQSSPKWGYRYLHSYSASW